MRDPKEMSDEELRHRIAEKYGEKCVKSEGKAADIDACRAKQGEQEKDKSHKSHEARD